MLKIRSEQVPALSGDDARAYRQQALEYVRERFPRELERRGEDGVALLVDRAIGDAVSYRLASSVDVTGLLTLMLLLGERFASEPRHAWMREILLSAAIHPGEKIAMILDELCGPTQWLTFDASLGRDGVLGPPGSCGSSTTGPTGCRCTRTTR